MRDERSYGIAKDLCMTKICGEKSAKRGCSYKSVNITMFLDKLSQCAGDLIFPRRCPVCEEPVSPSGALICPECEGKLHFIKEPACKICGREIAEEEAELCCNCKRHRFSFEYGYSLMNYDDVAARSISRIKYTGAREYLDYYGKKAVELYGERIKSIGIDALVPVPVHRSRFIKRGYNQAEVLASVMGKELDIPVYEDAMVRNKKTTALKELSASERLKNLTGAFSAGEIPYDMHSVLLIDDIFTSGATLEAISRCLKSAGVDRVYCFTLAIKPED
ncbi:ComF family protein [Oribacterium sp. WCC10]|uniref:ComF family protein n=1 Tax=Oribacterium sp. WCC10 TaxID=1855343 RepID=UPI0008EC78A4|nr:ComF family protein [Oribacterium sp. WCC10]SFG14494.1 comF family protein [Oribacterium sp. WCC10]